MEYIMITESKLKIILTREELESHGVSAEELDYGDPVSRSVFESLLSFAREKLGFNTSGHRVLLQLYPSRDGGCELFVTKLGALASEERSEKSERAFGKSNRKASKAPRPRAFSFESFSHLLALCKRLDVTGFSGESSAWLDLDGKWYLLIAPDREGAQPREDSFSFLSEYGEEESHTALSLYLGEYARNICSGNAIHTLGKI